MRDPILLSSDHLGHTLVASRDPKYMVWETLESHENLDNSRTTVWSEGKDLTYIVTKSDHTTIHFMYNHRWKKLYTQWEECEFIKLRFRLNVLSNCSNRPSLPQMHPAISSTMDGLKLTYTNASWSYSWLALWKSCEVSVNISSGKY